jgi:poly-gamma-glutamate capsule biosynthesis protein CapA/YwtB (metallophosphatase superfamily)
VRLALIGDVMLGRLVNDALKTEPPPYPWGNTLHVLKTADFRLCNLETAITDKGNPWSATPKVFHFRTDPINVGVLTAASISQVCLANNHILDYEFEGMFQTIEILKENGVNFAGAGEDLTAASMPAVSEVKRLKIGLISFTDNEPVWEATNERPGVFYVPIDLGDNRTRHLLETVEKAREIVDLLIVSPHWGPNWGYDPPPEHKYLAHALLDHGADIVFGHSAHIFRGIELYKGKPIFYNAGDFVNDYSIDEMERNDQGFIYILETEDTRVSSITLYPTLIREFQVVLAREFEAREITEKMAQLCLDFNTPSLFNPTLQTLEIPITSTA